MGLQPRQTRAEPSPAPTVKSQNSAYNYTHSLAVHCRGGALLHPRSLAGSQGFSWRAMLAPTMKLQKSDIFLRKPCLLLVGACIAGPLGPLCFWHSCSPPIRAKTFSYSTKKTRKFIVRRSYFLVHHRGLSRGLTNTALWCWLPPAGGRPVLVRGASQKRAPDPEIGGFFWCTIGDSNPGPTD